MLLHFPSLGRKFNISDDRLNVGATCSFKLSFFLFILYISWICQATQFRNDSLNDSIHILKMHLKSTGIFCVFSIFYLWRVFCWKYWKYLCCMLIIYHHFMKQKMPQERIMRDLMAKVISTFTNQLHEP